MTKIPPSRKLVKELKERVQKFGMSLRELVREGARLMLQTAIEEEMDEFLGRGHYERQSPDKEFRGYRNGYEKKKLETGEGPVEIQVPQLRDNKEEFKSRWITAYLKRTETVDGMIKGLYVRGLSFRDVESVMTEVLTGEGVSRSAASRVAEKLNDDLKVWKERSLAEENILYMFLDAAYWKVRENSGKEAVLVAYGIRRDGKKVLLDVELGSKENADGWMMFLHGLKERGLGEPLMIVYDGNPGVRKACKEVFPHSLKQRCQVHKMRNILSKLPKAMHAEMKALIQRSIFEADSHEKALAAGKRLIARFKSRYAAAMECLEKDLEECIQCLKLPEAHRMRLRTTNVLERLLGEAKRRTKVIPYFRSEAAAMKLLFATLITASKLWRGVKMDAKINKQLRDLEAQLFRVSRAA